MLKFLRRFPSACKQFLLALREGEPTPIVELQPFYKISCTTSVDYKTLTEGSKEEIHAIEVERLFQAFHKKVSLFIRKGKVFITNDDLRGERRYHLVTYFTDLPDSEIELLM